MPAGDESPPASPAPPIEYPSFQKQHRSSSKPQRQVRAAPREHAHSPPDHKPASVRQADKNYGPGFVPSTHIQGQLQNVRTSQSKSEIHTRRSSRRRVVINLNRSAELQLSVCRNATTLCITWRSG